MTEIVESLCQALPTDGMPVNLHDHVLVHLDGKKERDCVVCGARGDGVRHRSKFMCRGCNAGVNEMCFPKLLHYRRHKGAKRPRQHRDVET